MAMVMSAGIYLDFGIGDPADLFQALIIYTRVLSGYYESVYKFNLSVALKKPNIIGLIPKVIPVLKVEYVL